MTDNNFIAETICTALCSRPDVLAVINQQLSSLMTDIEDPDTDVDSVWSYEQQTLIYAFIEESANMVSQVVNGNKR